MPLIDLRSDTVTRPTAAMREAMARAEVGDDVYGEDPSVRALEERVAELLGKERALFVPSGTMSNQIALLLHCERGDEVIVAPGTHCNVYEAGAGAAWAGVQFTVAGDEAAGLSVDDLDAALKPAQYYLPRSRLLVLENTHNRRGGAVSSVADSTRLALHARERGLRTHLDGARLWNAAVALGVSEAALAEPFHTVSVCFSKGLGAPVGSALVGAASDLERARRLRKMLGGGMRQAGVLAAAALHAVDHHRQRLAEDHRAARAIGALLTQAGHAPAPVHSNIVNLPLPPGHRADAAVAAARAAGVLVSAMDARTLRLVTHLDVAVEAAEEGARRLIQALRAGAAS